MTKEEMLRRLYGEGPELLTHRQQEVATLLAGGLGTKEIATKLNISVDTARNHTERVMRKLHTHDRYALMLWAIKTGLAPCPCGLWPNRVVPI